MKIELTECERKCLDEMVKSFSPKTVGHTLGIHVKTVQCHLRNASIKLEARNRLHAVLIYDRMNREFPSMYMLRNNQQR